MAARRRTLLLLLLLVTLGVGALGAYRVALERLRTGLAAALGPRASVAAVELGWTGLTLRDLHVASAPGWPAEEELHAGTVRVWPDLWGALGGTWRLRRVEISDARLVLLRARDGRLRVLPAILARSPGVPQAAPASARAASAGPAEPAAAWRVHVGEVVLQRVQVDFYDASLRLARPHRLRLVDLEARLGDLALPALDEAMKLQVTARVKGPTRDGQLALNGVLTPATRDADLKAEMSSVDLLAFQPYLLRVSDGGIRRGRLDLRLSATVKQQHLRAPGQLTLTGLELAPGSGVLGRLNGLSRQAAVAALSRRDRITLDFTLDGRLDDPNFSVNESLAMRFATGLAEALGVSLQGVVEGVGQVFKGLLGR